jgi:hypothetical protein
MKPGTALTALRRHGGVAGLPGQQTRWLISYTAQLASDVSCWQRDRVHIEKVFDSVAAATIVQTLILGHDLTTDDIASITINMSDKEAHVVDNRDMPAVNLQYLIAVMILDGMESFTSADDEARIDD